MNEARGDHEALPAIRLQPPVLDPGLARRIRVVGLDIDGTLTDGGVYLGASSHEGRSIPFELKRYDIQDGLGVTLLRECGIKVAIVTGRVSDSVAQRARELQVDALAQDPQARKLAAWRRVLHELGCRDDEAAFVGDDLPDLPILRRVALPVAVGNAVPEVRRSCTWQLARAGGHGAVREFAEGLLDARDEWHGAVERYVFSRSREESAS
ncbi:MAG: HAD hydrolase family protein [Gemmatimonadaceae bacterium]|nr:HAD hydrolase family protein [Gemmatimonadaceae bacterium]